MNIRCLQREEAGQWRDRPTGAWLDTAWMGRRSVLWGRWMWCIGAGMSVMMAWSWATGQRAHASASQGTDPASVAVEAGSPGSMATDHIKKAGSESSTTGGEPVQGPALTVPEEMVAMFQQRKQDLERRENLVREAEAKLAILKAEVEQILSQVEAAEQRRKQASPEKHTVDTRTQQLGQLAKMYESMPAEEAAERIERMTNRKALEILRLLKSKSAGAILAQVKVDRAAKLSEEFLTTP